MDNLLFNFSSAKLSDTRISFKIDKKYFNIIDPDLSLTQVDLSNGNLLFVLGDFFYIKNQSNSEHISVNTDTGKAKLEMMFQNQAFAPFKIKHLVEGDYLVIYIDKAKLEISVYGDFFNRVNFYYATDGENLWATTGLTSTFVDIAGPEINECTLVDILNQNYSIDSGTIYRNIERLAFNQALKFTPKGWEIVEETEFKPLVPYTHEQLNEYERLFSDAVISRSGKNANVVLCSGGWDSTMIVDVLREKYDSQNIHGACFSVILDNGKIFNIFEVEKVKEICKHYQMKLLQHDVDITNKNYLDTYLEYIKNLKYNHIFALSNHFYHLTSMIHSNFGADTVVFNGEGSDSLHNFGFSQYISINHPHPDFAQYADKMRCYLYGPTFFKKIISNDYNSDAVFNIFKSVYNMSDRLMAYADYNERVFYYLLSFLYSNERIPFAPAGMMEFVDIKAFNERYIPQFQKKLSTEVNLTNPENLFSVLSRLYCRFWLKGSNIMRAYHSIKDLGLQPALPFLDSNLFAFLEQMPESWGRGLEFNTVKYPLKKMARKRTSFPYDIVNRGPHSYLSEVEPDAKSIVYHYICNSALTPYFKDILSDKTKLSFFDQPILNRKYIQKTIEAFLSDRVQNHQLKLLQNIVTLTSTLNAN